MTSLAGLATALLPWLKKWHSRGAYIAGICSADGNVVGLMPHPERASDMLLGSTDGLVLLRAFLSAPALRRA